MRATEPLYDVVGLGEVMLRLASRAPIRLEQAQELDASFGGAEANVLCALARLGLRTAWLSALPSNPWGERCARELKAHGVDVAPVVWRARGRIGTYFLEYGVPPRPIRVLYDRQDSAFTTLGEAEVNWEVVRRSRVVHVTGITPALGERPRGLTGRAVEEAHAGGAVVSLDVNYRAALWSPEEAASYLDRVLPRVEILFIGLEDARRLFGCEGEPEAVAETLRRRAPKAIVALTLGDQGSVVLADRPHRPTRLYPLEVVADRLGAGDAFAAGFLYGFLTRHDVQYAQDCGTALAALKCTMWGDVAIIRPGELEELMTQPDPRIRR
ncbi:MAG: sugar kinase [Candidatus Rokubacteria bacterium]|nr:sugar kinase [Candidatus Rokubacteria bacterium]